MESTTVQPALDRRPSQRATIEEWLAIPEEKRAELIDGVIVYQGMPGPLHGEVQGKTFSLADGPFGRRIGGGDRPGGFEPKRAARKGKRRLMPSPLRLVCRPTDSPPPRRPRSTKSSAPPPMPQPCP